MTTFDRMTLRSKNEGIVEGKTEEQNLFISNSLKEGLTIELIAKITQLPKEEILKRIKDMNL